LWAHKTERIKKVQAAKVLISNANQWCSVSVDTTNINAAPGPTVSIFAARCAVLFQFLLPLSKCVKVKYTDALNADFALFDVVRRALGSSEHEQERASTGEQARKKDKRERSREKRERESERERERESESQRERKKDTNREQETGMSKREIKHYYEARWQEQ
jgi:hypothetical protein